MLKRYVAVFVCGFAVAALTLAASAAPQEADPGAPVALRYNDAVTMATRNLTSLLTLDDAISQLRDALKTVTDERDAMINSYSPMMRPYVESAIRDAFVPYIRPLERRINELRYSQDMIKLGTELQLLNSINAIENALLDIALTELAIEQDEASLEAARARWERGTGSESDYRAAEFSLAQRRVNLSALRVSLDNERMSLSRLLNKPVTEVYAVDYGARTPALPDDLEAYIAKALKEQPNILQKESEAARAKAEYDESSGAPQSERDALKRAQTRAERELEDMKKNLELAIRKQYNNILALQYNGESLEIDLKRANDRLETLRLNLDAGLVTPLELGAGRLGVESAKAAIAKNNNNYRIMLFMFANPFLLAQ
jgi:hypothetical protein